MYWIPLFEVLDRTGFELYLVNPHGMLDVNLTAIPTTIGTETVLTLAAKIGANLSRFSTAAHCC